MTGDVLAAVSTGETIAFWVLAPLCLIAATAMVLARNAVHASLFLAAVMLSLAGLYAAQDAPFLAAVQVIVYTGAVLMLFLFVLMLVGVDASDSLVETLRGQRVATLVLALGFGLLMATTIATAVGDADTGLSQANQDGNVEGIARLLFSKYVFAFEATSALLITAALGAMVLAHKERIGEAALTQKQRARARFASGHPHPLPGPGVFALHDSTATAALLPDGSPAPGSVSTTLAQDTDGPVVQG